MVAVAEDPYAPWYARWVLYQGRAIGDAARDAYFREINNVLVPREVHEAVVVLADGGRLRSNDGYDGLGHGMGILVLNP